MFKFVDEALNSVWLVVEPAEKAAQIEAGTPSRLFLKKSNPAQPSRSNLRLNASREHRSSVGRSDDKTKAGRRGRNTLKSESREVRLLDERLDDPDRVLLSDKFVQMLGTQNALPPVLTLDKAPHPDSIYHDSSPTEVFTQLRPSADPNHNAIRGHLAEFGMVVARGPLHIAKLMAAIEGNHTAFPQWFGRSCARSPNS